MFVSTKLISSPNFHFTLNPNPKQTPLTQYSVPCPRKSLIIPCAKKVSKRTGKMRYPSEKKKLREIMRQQKIEVEEKFNGVWRLFKLAVSVDRDPGKDFIGVSDALLEEIAKVLKFPVASMLPPEAFKVIRKSFDARKRQKEPKFVYTVEMDANKLNELEPHVWDFIAHLEPRIGLIEHMPHERVLGDVVSIIHENKKVDQHEENAHSGSLGGSDKLQATQKPKIAVVGSGPSGLFASLVLAEFGADVTLIERGQAVEKRGRDIGALVVRRILERESNFCFGEVLGATGS